MGRRTSFVAWISVTRPETMKMAFTMFDDNANGRPMGARHEHRIKPHV